MKFYLFNVTMDERPGIAIDLHILQTRVPLEHPTYFIPKVKVSGHSMASGRDVMPKRWWNRERHWKSLEI